MPKGTCWAETTSNSEKIKPIALAVIELCLSEGISQSVTIYDRIEARAFISYKSFLTQRLNETGINLDPGIYFLLATC